MGATVVKETQEKMEKTIEATKNKFAAIRAGRANVNMLEGVMVNSYGSPTPLKQVGQISAPESRLLTIDPWDKSLIKEIEKGIQLANLGFNPSNDGKVIRILIPELTQDRRKEYLKIVKKEAEDGKVAIRNIRKDMNNKLRKLEKDGDISEDELKGFETKIQDITDKFIKEVDELYSKKEKELTTV